MHCRADFFIRTGWRALNHLYFAHMPSLFAYIDDVHLVAAMMSSRVEREGGGRRARWVCARLAGFGSLHSVPTIHCRS
ncbi:hypothetical protein C9J85_15120 [Haloferax sp. wsp5]|nr:hypothetical protein C9J85_15120 [Haloferax sp. wsp5]